MKMTYELIKRLKSPWAGDLSAAPGACSESLLGVNCIPNLLRDRSRFSSCLLETLRNLFSSAPIRGKVKAGSLIELMIAAMVLLIVFGISLQILVNTESVSHSALKVKAYAAVASEIEEAKQRSDWQNKSQEIGNLTLETTVSEDSTCASLVRVEVTAKLNNTGAPLYREIVILGQ